MDEEKISTNQQKISRISIEALEDSLVVLNKELVKKNIEKYDVEEEYLKFKNQEIDKKSIEEKEEHIKAIKDIEKYRKVIEEEIDEIKRRMNSKKAEIEKFSKSAQTPSTTPSTTPAQTPAQTQKQYNVLIAVDLQNCFIQGGSLNIESVEQLAKYHKLVKEIENEIQSKTYDLVVFSKDKHPINHSSLAENLDPIHGVYPHHCRDIKCNCKANSSTYFSKEAQVKVKDLLLKRLNLESTDSQLKILNKDQDLKIPNILDEITEDEKIEIENLANDEKHMKTDQPKTIEDLLTPHNNQENLSPAKKIVQDLVKDKNIAKKKVIGLDLNYLFHDTKLSGVIDELNKEGGNSEIGFADDVCSNEIDLEQIDDNEHPYTFKDTISPVEDKYVTISKGRLCNYESYSAFNYHIKIKKNEESMTKTLFGMYDSSMNEVINLPAKRKYSTGLFEYITTFFKLSSSNEENPITLNINVCGLVTNICVINTIQQGIALWNSVYSNGLQHVTCNFKLLDYISVPLSLNIPGVESLYYPYSDSISSNKIDKKKQRDNLIELLNAKFKFDILVADGNDIDTILNGSIKSYSVSISRQQSNDILFNLQDLKSGGTKSIRNKARTKAAENKPSTKKAEEKKPATKKAEEKKPSTKKAAEKKPSTKKAEEKKPATKKAAEKKSTTKKAAEKKSTTKKAAEKKPATKKA